MRVLVSFKDVKDSKSDKVIHFSNFFIELDNGRKVAIKCPFTEDYKILSAVAVKE